MVTTEHLKQVMDRGADGMITLTFDELKRSDQGYLLKNTISVWDSAIDTIEH